MRIVARAERSKPRKESGGVEQDKVEVVRVLPIPPATLHTVWCGPKAGQGRSWSPRGVFMGSVNRWCWQSRAQETTKQTTPEAIIMIMIIIHPKIGIHANCCMRVEEWARQGVGRSGRWRCWGNPSVHTAWCAQRKGRADHNNRLAPGISWLLTL